MTHRLAIGLAMILAAVTFVGCGGGGEGDDASQRTVTIGLVAKSQSNAVFQAAYAGAKDAAAELGDKYGVRVRIDWQTPADEDATMQAKNVEQLARAGADGIAVSCSNADTLTPAIDKAVELGSVVMTFDSDAPASKRFCFFGTNDLDCGQAVMTELAAVMGESGNIAILAGNQAAPNLRNRVEGVKRKLAEYPDMALIEDGVVYHAETAAQAAEALNAAQTTRPEIEGWALVGGWPLFTKNALRWPAGEVKVVSVDALPDQLDYLDSGHVQVLLAQNCYGWGYESVRILLEKILKNNDPSNADAKARIFDPLTRITPDNAAAFRESWNTWLK